MKRILVYIGFWIWSLTWGSIMTAVGLLVALALLVTGHKPYFMGPQMFFKFGTGWGGVNFGPIAVVCSNASINTEYHEAGHGLQNLIWGPLMPFVVSIPSAIRYWYREWVYRKDKKKYRELPDYDAIWFEAQASNWGKAVYSLND